ncbi:MAG: hypothetical protein KJ065_07510 [Anaerolineae bacterium]|nr:hypothetical protein [Anaerolineae bacterium]
MAEMFAITSPQAEPLKLDGLGRGQFRVRVVNLSGRALFAEAHILPEEERVTSWFEVTPPVDRHYAIGASYDYLVNVRAKALARPGTYKYRFIMKITDTAGEEPDTLSDELSLTLTRRILPWRTLLVLLFLLIAVGAVIGAFVGGERITSNRLVPTITALAQDRQFLGIESVDQVATLQAQETRVAIATATLVPQATRIVNLQADVNARDGTIAALSVTIDNLRQQIAALQLQVNALEGIDVAITSMTSSGGTLNIAIANVGQASSPAGNLRLNVTVSVARINGGTASVNIDVPPLSPGERTVLPMRSAAAPPLVSAHYVADLEIAGDNNLSNNHREFRQ